MSKFDSNDSSEAKPKEKTYSYVRSKRQVQTLIKDKFDMDAGQLETDNMNLVKRIIPPWEAVAIVRMRILREILRKMDK